MKMKHKPTKQEIIALTAAFLIAGGAVIYQETQVECDMPGAWTVVDKDGKQVGVICDGKYWQPTDRYVYCSKERGCSLGNYTVVDAEGNIVASQIPSLDENNTVYVERLHYYEKHGDDLFFINETWVRR